MTTHQQCLRKNDHEPHEWPIKNPTHYCRGRVITTIPYPIHIKDIAICEQDTPHKFHNFNRRVPSDPKMFQIKACPGWSYAGGRPDPTPAPHQRMFLIHADDMPIVEDEPHFFLVTLGEHKWRVPKSVDQTEATKMYAERNRVSSSPLPTHNPLFHLMGVDPDAIVKAIKSEGKKTRRALKRQTRAMMGADHIPEEN